MPPLPATKISPGRDYRTENNHNRGHSFKFGMTLHATKDDDLALFNDMQIKERESFLLHTSDDFNEALNIKLGVTIPDRGGRDDLLDADCDKNDYGWLVTPPDTPLFPSLDDEEPQSHKQPIRGRPRSQPVSVSRSLAMNDISQKNTRINASPRRLSPSPRSNNNSSFVKSTSRPSSAIRSSPPPVSRPMTPSRRPSSPNRPSTPRSLTPTPKVHGTSPLRSSRGNSASPKVCAWQTNLLGFSSDVPPNLRTSLSDRPSPPTRGLSPTPSSGRGRHSMSPTCSRRSVSSSNSNGRDLFSSCSKSSFVSSCDDDVDSLQSVAVPKNSTTTRNRMVGNSKAMGLSRKSTRSLASNSVPKRSFECDIRQSDQHKTQKMFRPLLSSVPATTFYVGKASNTNRIMFSRNSSLTTNTSASSDQGTNAVGEWEKMHDSAIQDEIFVFDKGDDIIDYAEEMHGRNPVTDSGMFDQSMSVKVDVPELDGEDVKYSEMTATCTKCGKCFGRLRLDENIDICEECTKIDSLFAVTELLSPSNDSESVYGPKGLSMDDNSEFLNLCSKCGKDFYLLGLDENLIVCEECIKIDGLYNAAKPLLHHTANNNEINQSELANNVDTSVSEDKYHVDPPEKPCSSNGEALPSHNKCTTEQDVGLTELSCGNNVGSAKLATHTSLTIENLEGKGISILLPCQASNNRSPIIQSTAFTAASLLCADPSYARDNASALRRSIEKEITSTSSSIDMGSYKQTNNRIRRQLSGSKYEVISVRCDTDARSQHSSSYSEFTANTYGSFTPSKTDDGELSVSFTKSLEKEASLKAVLVDEELDRSLDLPNLISTNIDGSNKFNDEQSALEIKQSSAYTSCDNSEDQAYSACMSVNEEPQKENDATEDISISNDSENVLNDHLSCQNGSFDTVTNSSNLPILESQIELGSSEPDINSEPAHFPTSLEALHEHSITTVLEDLADSTLESFSNHNHGIPEESTVIVEGKQGHASRSLTLAEATDTILFCSSIIHDITYKAASIAIEKESATHPEASKPTVTIIDKSVNAHRGSIRTNNRITTKSAKFGRKKTETQTKLPLKESETNVNVEESTPLVNKENITTRAPDSIKPPKLESKCNCIIM